MATISNTSRPGYVWDTTDNVWYPIGTGVHTHDYVASTLIDAKGDLIVGSAADTAARLAVGTNGHTLVADSAEATGLKWAAPASGGMTLIQETVANADTSISFGSIAGTYKQLLLVWSGLSNSNTTTTFDVRLNNNSSSVYAASTWGFAGTSTIQVNKANYTNLGFYNNTIGEGVLNTNAYDQSTGSVLIDNYASSTKYKQYSGMRRYTFGNGEHQWHSVVGFFASTTAITSIDIYRAAGAGTLSNAANTSIRLYGIS